MKTISCRALLLLVPLACLAACSSAGASTSTGDGGAGLSACTWPASFDPTDATTGQCTAARLYLSCQGSNGGGELCMSNDPEQCPGPDVTPGVTYSNCVDQCHDREYALACGGVGPGPKPLPPAGCRELPPNPGGVAYYCCPCGA